jgi:uncharacterized Zn-binding protein involved in type VI secretion
MPAAARSSGQDKVFSKTGAGYLCGSPVQTITNEGSPDVFINGYGIVRQGDKVGVHPRAGCSTDVSVLTTFSSTVFINGKGAGRIGDEYTSDNILISGSRNIFIGG